MPNWAEGVLKLRGTKASIKRFLFEELEAIPGLGQELKVLMGKQDEVKKPNVETTEDEWDLSMKSPNGFYVKGTRRAFIESTIEWFFSDEDTEVLTIDSFKQAWGVDSEPFIEISKKYDLDIRIYVFEKGMQFNQEVEIHRGELIKDHEIKFDDYEWECLLPNFGG